VLQPTVRENLEVNNRRKPLERINRLDDLLPWNWTPLTPMAKAA